jgi:hypothetical protein
MLILELMVEKLFFSEQLSINSYLSFKERK